MTPSVHAAAASAAEGLTLEESFFDELPTDLDLDGNGTGDTFLNGGATSNTVTQRLYLKPPGCGYPLGIVESVMGLQALTTKSRGLIDSTRHS